jgi:exosome complex RNA-binding protein Rrp4
LRSFNKESCSLAQNLTKYILVQIFLAREGHVWIKSNLNEFEII